MRLGFIGGGRKRKIKELEARGRDLARLIHTCEHALEACVDDPGTSSGYRAAHYVRASLLHAEIAQHQTELDGIAAQLAALEVKRPSATDPGPDAGHRFTMPGLLEALKRRKSRRDLVGAAVAGAILLLAAILPLQHAFGVIPTLIATQEVIIEVDPRTLDWSAAPALDARSGDTPYP